MTSVTSATKTTEIRKDVSKTETIKNTSSNVNVSSITEKKPLDENRGERSGRLGFNRPAYIRKLKKIAEDF